MKYYPDRHLMTYALDESHNKIINSKIFKSLLSPIHYPYLHNTSSIVTTTLSTGTVKYSNIIVSPCLYSWSLRSLDERQGQLDMSFAQSGDKRERRRKGEDRDVWEGGCRAGMGVGVGGAGALLAWHLLVFVGWSGWLPWCRVSALLFWVESWIPKTACTLILMDRKSNNSEVSKEEKKEAMRMMVT